MCRTTKRRSDLVVEINVLMKSIEDAKEKMEGHRRAAEDHRRAAAEHRRAFQLSCQAINEAMEKAAQKEEEFMKSVTSKL